MSNLNIRVKKILEDIIDNAYKDESEENIEKYKKFYLQIIQKERTSVSGWYKYANHSIEVFNLSRGSGAIVKTCIHELAHHIDYCKNGESGHQEPFYKEYKILLYTALNMKIFSPEDVAIDKTSSDYNKVMKMVNEWVPEYIDYKQDVYYITILNGYQHKDQLKANGYTWDSIQNKWCKEVSQDELEEEREFLFAAGIDNEISDGSNLNIMAVTQIIATGKTYEVKEFLKEDGFFFSNKEKVWKKKCWVNEVKNIIAELSNKECYKKVTFGIVKK